MLSTLEYPHWMMIAGGFLVVLGFLGFAFRMNNSAQSDREPAPDEPMASPNEDAVQTDATGTTSSAQRPQGEKPAREANGK